MSDAITITRSTAADSEDVRRLALLDDRRAPVGPALLYVDGELRAALGSWTARRSLIRSIRPGLVEILRFQARQEVAA